MVINIWYFHRAPFENIRNTSLKGFVCRHDFSFIWCKLVLFTWPHLCLSLTRQNSGFNILVQLYYTVVHVPDSRQHVQPHWAVINLTPSLATLPRAVPQLSFFSLFLWNRNAQISLSIRKITIPDIGKLLVLNSRYQTIRNFSEMGLQVDVCWIPVFHHLYAHIFWQYFPISVWFLLVVEDKKQGKGKTSVY